MSTFDYTETDWNDGAPPDITAAQLERIEAGVKAASTVSYALDTRVTDVEDGKATKDGTGKVPVAELGTGAVGAGAKYLADDRTWKSVSGGVSSYIDISARGAVGDDATDNTTVIQTALDELAARGGGTLYIPNRGEGSNNPSIYRSNGLWVSGRVRILSDGAILRCTGDSPQARKNVYGTPRTTGAALAFSQQDYGGYVQEAPFRAGVQGLVIVMNSNLNGIYINGGEQVWITGNVIKSGTAYAFDGILLDARAVGTGTGEMYAKHVFIRDNLIDGCTRNGITVTSGEDVIIAGNSVKNVVGSTGNPCCGIELEPDFPAPGATTVYHVYRRVAITGNTVNYTDGPGIAVVADPNNSGMGSGRCADIAIVGNTVRDASTPHTYSTINGGIYFSGGDGDGSIVVSGNTVRGIGNGSAIQGYPYGADGHAEVRFQLLIVGNNVFSVSLPHWSTVAQPKVRSNFGVADSG